MFSFIFIVEVRNVSLFKAHLILKRKSPSGNSWIVKKKKKKGGEQPRWFSMQAYACVWDWKPTFHGSNVHSHKNILFRAFRAALWSLQTLSNANTAESRVTQTPQTLSCYLICCCGSTRNSYSCFSNNFSSLTFIWTACWFIYIHQILQVKAAELVSNFRLPVVSDIGCILLLPTSSRHCLNE